MTARRYKKILSQVEYHIKAVILYSFGKIFFLLLFQEKKNFNYLLK